MGKGETMSRKMTDLINTVHCIATDEMNRANKEWPAFSSKHEALGVLDEEIFEMEEELKGFRERNIELHTAVYRDYDMTKALRNAEHRMAAALAEGTQVLAMIKKFRCLLESEEKKHE